MNKPKQSVFQLEENITRAYAIMQAQVHGFVKSSKFSYGEIAKKMKIDRATFTKRFKEQTWTAKQFYELLDLLNSEFNSILEAKEKSLELKEKNNE